MRDNFTIGSYVAYSARRKNYLNAWLGINKKNIKQIYFFTLLRNIYLILWPLQVISPKCLQVGFPYFIKFEFFFSTTTTASWIRVLTVIPLISMQFGPHFLYYDNRYIISASIPAYKSSSIGLKIAWLIDLIPTHPISLYVKLDAFTGRELYCISIVQVQLNAYL